MTTYDVAHARHDGSPAMAGPRACETARGIGAVADIAAAPNCAALIWGAEDLTADLGGSSRREASGTYRPVMCYARSKVLPAAAAVGLPAIDAVFLSIEDREGPRRESEDAAQSGLSRKHAFTPHRSRWCAWPTCLAPKNSTELGVWLPPSMEVRVTERCDNRREDSGSARLSARTPDPFASL